ncbi:MAG: ATP-binding protein [Gammaproteobacteria bacterium]
MDKAQHGERQVVFVTGEPGIGKTTLIEAFLFGVRSYGEFGVQNIKLRTENSELSSTSVFIAHGQCVEHYGAGEAYLPVLDALGRLCRGPGGAGLIALLHQHAPTWLTQMPALLSTVELQALHPRVLGATRERMLRELAEALEVLTAADALVLVLEDLHWADVSTLDLLAVLARRPGPARMLVLGTYRPAEMLGDGHPLNSLVHELLAHRLGVELALGLLSEDYVAAYLQQRFSQSVFPPRLTQVLHRRTDGNPFFLVSMVDDLVAQGVILQADDHWVLQDEGERLMTTAPESIRHLVARQRERLQPGDQQLLRAASVAGMEFSVAVVAAALETEVVSVGEQCARLAERHQFLRSMGIVEWPDGSVASRYGFTHALYQHLWHERVSIEQQQQWHLRIGERKEAAYGNRASEIAAELAMHFEQGHDYRRAVPYLWQAAQNAMQRSAPLDAIILLTKGLRLLETLPDTLERLQLELFLQTTLGTPLIVTQGYGTPEVEKVYARAQVLCQQVGEIPQLFPVLLGLWIYTLVRGKPRQARQLGEQLLSPTYSVQSPGRLLRAHTGLGMTLFFLGELAPAHEHLKQSLALYDPQQHRSYSLRDGQDFGVISLSFSSLILWLLGYPDQALKKSHEALTLARELHPFSLVWALIAAAIFHQLRREGQAVLQQTETLFALLEKQGFSQFVGMGMIYQGVTLCQQGQAEEGVTQIQQGLAAQQVAGMKLVKPYHLSLLAEGYGKASQPEQGLKVLAEALEEIRSGGEQVYEAEIYRLKGELTLQKFQVPSCKFQVGQNPKSKVQGPRSTKTNAQHLNPNSDAEAEAEAYFLKAIEIARQQQAKSLELRAVMSLVRLRQHQAQDHATRTTHHAVRPALTEAHRMLATIYNWFTEGFDTADLQEARTLLEELRQ